MSFTLILIRSQERDHRPGIEKKLSPSLGTPWRVITATGLVTARMYSSNNTH